MDQGNDPRRRRRRRARRVSPAVWVLAALLLLLTVAAGLLWFFGYEMAFQEAWNTMPRDGKLLLTEQEDGTLLLQWPKGTAAHYYGVTVLEAGEKPFFETQTEDTQCPVPDLPDGKTLTIQVQSFAWYKTLTSQKARPGEYALTATGSFAPPELRDVQWTADPDGDTVTLEYDLQKNQVCQIAISLEGDSRSWELELTEERTTLHFGQNQKFPMPEHGKSYHIGVSSYIDDGSIRHQGLCSYAFLMDREALLGNTLVLEARDLGHNQFTLTWNETKGEGYEIQQYDPKSQQWVAVSRTAKEGKRTYTTGYLARYQDHRFRVVALEEADIAPAEVTVQTGPSLIYSTVWPLTNQTVYETAEKSGKIGIADKGLALCVVGEENGMLRVRYKNRLGWIDGNYCMINLPDYLGELCSYDITNSYRSIFSVHGYEIPGTTGTVLKGYEQVKTGKDQYLVPLLYPTALKLEKAAREALKQGYRLKIYDAYRPGQTSRTVRYATEAILDQPLPEKTYDGASSQVQTGTGLTYNELMTGSGQYSINYFIADFGSRHNFGVALDLTLEDAETGKELTMQSAIHDLSHYAVLSRNGENADRLSRIMKGAGFATLVSEWWHFQDNQARDSLELKALWQGLTPQGWKADGNGWRYRKADGSFYKNCSQTIDGTDYRFDGQGYLMEEE